MKLQTDAPFIARAVCAPGPGFNLTRLLPSMTSTSSVTRGAPACAAGVRSSASATAVAMHGKPVQSRMCDELALKCSSALPVAAADTAAAPRFKRYPAFSAMTPTATAATPAQRRGVRCSFSMRAPISVANSTDVSRSEATRATGAFVIAQTEIA